jgi:LacI family transcriptional regulator
MEDDVAPSAPKKQPNIYEVARHAAVSPATVSRVMNGIAVDPVLADRVRASAAELNFVPNQVAVNLSRRRTLTIGVLVPDLANPTFQEVLRGIDRAAAAAGYHVLIADSSENPAAEAVLARETRRRADAIILCAPRMPTSELNHLVDELRPVVVVNRFDPVPEAALVAADYRGGIAAIVDHLFALGHRHLLYLSGNPMSGSNRQRLDGLAQAVHDRPGLKIDVEECGVGFSNGFDAVDRVLSSPATAVVAFNDLVAMGLLSALHEKGVVVPDEISVTGFDGIQFSAYTTPPLTTVSVPAVELGGLAWERIWESLSAEERQPPTTIATSLIARSSSAPPRRRPVLSP